MKKPFYGIAFFFLLLFSRLNTQAQFVTAGYSDGQFQKIINAKKVFVMLTGLDALDESISDAMKKHWKITPFEMVSKEDIAEKTYYASDLFLVPAAYGLATFNTTSVGGTNSNAGTGGVWALFPGGSGMMSDMSLFVPHVHYMREMLAFVPFEIEGGFGWDNSTNIYNGLFHQRYRIGDMVAGLNNSIELVRDNKYEFSGNNCVKFFFENCYNTRADTLKEKTLYLLKDDFQKEVDLKKVYPYKYKFVDYDEYTTVIKDEEEGAIYLLLSRGVPSAMYLIDAHSHRTVGGRTIQWADSRIEMQTIDAGDIKKLVNTSSIEAEEKK